MKFLLDSCIGWNVHLTLVEAGHDVAHVGDRGKDPSDPEILARACAEGRILVTLDKGFGRWAVKQRHPHRGILRLLNLSTQEQVEMCLNVLIRHASELEAGAIVTATPDKIRIRHPRR